MNKIQIAKTIEMFDAGSPLQEIADEIGMSMASASRVLHANGRSAWDRRYPDTEGRDEDAMIQDYQNYMPLEEVLHKYHVSQTTLYRRLHELKIEQRDKRPSMRGEKNPQYKHGKGDRRRERTPELTKQVAAICLGHVVPRGWHIHHIDGSPQNNRPENLMIFPRGKDHMSYHQRLLEIQPEDRSEDETLWVSRSGGFLLPVPDRPLTVEYETDRLFPPQIQE